MSRLRNFFTSGKMNQDMDSRIVPPGEYRNALNFSPTTSAADSTGAMENSLSTLQLTDVDLGTAPYVTLGMFMDPTEDMIYWFVLSASGSYVVEFATLSGIATIVLEDTSVGLLNFNASNLITGVAVIFDSDNSNKFLLWTDNLNPVRNINVPIAKAYGANNFTEADICLIKAPPLDKPTIVGAALVSGENNIASRFLRFGYRYKFLNGEFSAPSPFSDTAFLPLSFQFDYATSTNESMTNLYGQVTITFNTGPDLVVGIDLLFKESGSSTIYVIESFNKADESWSSNSDETFVFTNNQIYAALDADQLLRLYDAVPHKAQALEVIGNRVLLGFYTEGYDLVDTNSASVFVSYTLTLINTAITANTATRSLKSNRDYEIGMVYLDDFGRQTTVLTSSGSTVYIPNDDCDTANTIMVTIPIAFLPPTFATKYRFYIKQTRVDYDTIIPSRYYQDGVYRWVGIEGNDADKISIGEFIYMKSDSAAILAEAVQTKVLDIQVQAADFLDDGNTQIAGTYFKVKPDGYRLNEADFEVTENVFYGFRSGDTNNNFTGTRTSSTGTPIFYGTGLDDFSDATTLYTGITDIRYIFNIDGLGGFATGTAQCTSVIATDTITVNGLLYTAVAGVKADNTEFSIDTSDTACATDLADSITNDVRVGTTGDVTATSSTDTVTMTTDVGGTAGNAITLAQTGGTITLSGATFSGGTDDTFEWSNDNGSTYTTGVSITGANQAIETGIIIIFGAVNGHTLTDQWILSAKAEEVIDDTDNSELDGTAGTNHRRAVCAYAVKTEVGSEVIEGGTTIQIDYDDTSSSNVSGTESVVSIPLIATQDYMNMEEWFFGDSILTELQAELPDLDAEEVIFRKGYFNPAKDPPEAVILDDTYPYIMCLMSQVHYSGAAVIRVNVVTTVTELSNEDGIVFETIPINNDSDLFFEMGQTYDITGGFHQGNGGSDVNQTGAVAGEIHLTEVFNCFSWGNAFESYKIKDAFNANTMLFDTRTSSTIEDYRENVRIASLTYSKVYEQTTNYNGLNEFNASTSNFKDLDDKYQSIQKLYSTDTDVMVFQEDKVHRVLYQKDVLFDADASGNIRESSNILGQEVAYTGEYGISKNPESFAFFGNRKYFVDTRRGAVLRLSLDGITEISENGMHDFFRDSFRELPYTKKLGAWDLHEGQYVIHVDDTDTSPSTEIVCDATANFYQLSEAVSYNLLMNEGGGFTNMAYTISGSDTITVQVQENEGAGPTTTFTDISGTSTGSVTRTVTTPNTWIITVTPTSGTPDVTLNFPCSAAI